MEFTDYLINKTIYIMKNHKYTSNYGEVECNYFFDADESLEGIDVSVDGEHIGEIWDKFPNDLDEEEGIKKFEESIDEWLSRNY